MTKMRALVLERQHELSLRDIDLPMEVGPGQVKIKLHTVGVCGSDVHYYTHGKIGPFVVNAPMVLGHEAAGTVVEVGAGVTHLKVGDRVCMEPGVPDPNSRASRLGMYNIDPAVTFWATPPIHGVPDPLCRAPGQLHLQAARQCELCRRRHGRAVRRRHAGGDQGEDHPRRHGGGDGRRADRHHGRARGAGRRLLAGDHQPISPSPSSISPRSTRASSRSTSATRSSLDEVNRLTDNWGADVVFECSGSPAGLAGHRRRRRARAAPSSWSACRSSRSSSTSPRSRSRKSRIDTVFRYAHQYDRAIALMASGRVDLKPLISEHLQVRGLDQGLRPRRRSTADGREAADIDGRCVVGASTLSPEGRG